MHSFDYIATGQMSMFDFIATEEIRPEPEPEPEKDNKIYKSIKAVDMEVIKERNFVEICTDSRICITASVKLLKGNMVYCNEWYMYPFLTVCNDDKESTQQYNEHLKNILDRMTQPPRFEVNLPTELEDMYLCVNGNWSVGEYTFQNGAVVEN